MDSIRECPFCGGEAKAECHLLYSHLKPYSPETADRKYYVQCLICATQCGAKEYDTEQEAIAAWNTRTRDAEVEALKAERDKKPDMRIFAHEMSIDSEGAGMVVSGEPVSFFFDALINIFEHNGARNFLTITVAGRGKRYAINIENCDGEDSPAEKIARLEAELEQFRKARGEGRLVELPVELGQQLFQAHDYDIITWDVGYVIVDVYGGITLGCLDADDHDFSEEFLADCIGHKLKLTRAEAEAALRKEAHQ